MCKMPKIDFWVSHRILECPTEFPESLKKEIWARTHDFRKIIPYKHVHNAKNQFLGVPANPRVSCGVPFVPQNINLILDS
jgi:hypothetical protein